MNTDKLEAIAKLDPQNSNYKSMIQGLTGLTVIDTPKIDKNNMQVKFYYGLYDLKDNGDERLYKIGVANDLVTVCFEEITQIGWILVL